MDINKILAELHSQREQLEQAMIVLERLAQRTGKRRGRPPRWLAAPKAMDAAPPVQKPRRTLSPAVRKKMAAAQKKRWAAARKAKTTA
jgi:hypothetical protein